MGFKQKFGAWVGYDPQVTAAASSSQALAGLTKDLPQKVRVCRSRGVGGAVGELR